MTSRKLPPGKPIDIDILPWSTPWKLNRCRARRDHPDADFGANGRCDFKRKHRGFEHCLERGENLVFWSDIETEFGYEDTSE